MGISISRPIGMAIALLLVGSAARSQTVGSDAIRGATMQKVSFPHQTVRMVGNLFLPANLDKNKKYPAIVVTHPFGGVKEQAAGLYALKLAEQGFITLAFDASHNGESGGEPRQAEVPTDRVEDIRSAVDYLSNCPQVDPDRIGALGICAGGGYTMNAAQTEHRIYDYLDDSLPVFRKVFEKRMKGYRAMGYKTLEEGARMPLFPAGDAIQPNS